MKLFGTLQEKLSAIYQRTPKRLFGAVALVVFLVGIFAFSAKKPKPVKIEDLRKEKPAFSGIVDSVDPRDTWVSQIKTEIQNIQKSFEDISKKQEEASSQRIKDLEEKIIQLEQQNNSLPDLQSLATPEQTAADNFIQPEIKVEIEKPRPTLKHLSRSVSSKNPNEYIASGSFARAVLLTGVVAETSTKAATEATPVIMRLVDHSIFSKEFYNEELKEAILIGSCYGGISSERANCRLESLSLVGKNGNVIERPVEGWVIGEDGRPGIAGKVVDTSTKMAKAAFLNGVLGGVAGYLQNQASSGMSLSPFTGNNDRLVGVKAMQSAGASGVGSALDKLAEYAIKKAEQMNPVIVVSAGRVVDVVFKKGFHLIDETDRNGANMRIKTTAQENYDASIDKEVMEEVSKFQKPNMEKEKYF
jgi:conjugal transfer pilus assembly protein TraB